MNIFIILFLSSLISFVGSLQLGPVNLFIFDKALNNNKKAAYFIALGGVLPEFIYCSIAVYSGNLFFKFPQIFITIKILLIIIFTIIGFIFLKKKYKPFILNNNTYTNDKLATNYFIKGFVLAILNPQLLPFWMFVTVYFNSIHFLELNTKFDKIAFVLGSGLGAFLLLISIILMINKFKTKILVFLNNKYYYKSLGLLFLLIALQQLTSLF